MTPGARQAGTIALATLVTGAALFFLWRLFDGQVDRGEIWGSLRVVRGSGLQWLLVAGLFNIAVYQLPYMTSTAGLRYFPAFVVRQTSFALSNAVPGGAAIGMGVQYAMLKSYKIPSAATACTVAIASVWSTFMTLAMPVVALVGLFLIGRGTRSLVQAAGIGLLGIAAIIGLFALVLKSDRHAASVARPFGAVLNALLKAFRRSEINAVQRVLGFRRHVVAVVVQRWKAITFTNLLVQLGIFSVLLAAVFGMDLKIGVFEVFAAFGFSRLGTLVPLTPGGIGTTDALMVSLLNHYGIRLDAAIAVVVLWRAVSYLPQVLLGVVTFLYWQVAVALRPGSFALDLVRHEPEIERPLPEAR